MFKELMIEGTLEYYNFLVNNNKGKMRIDVSKIEPKKDSSYFMLTIEKKIPFIEGANFEILGKEVKPGGIRIAEYDETGKQLIVFADQVMSKVLAETKPRDIKVVSDMRFLVKRVEQWYREYGDYIRLPRKRPEEGMVVPDIPGKKPSEEQSAAIKGVMAEPFSYVWGAPGTGKTKFVLARCVLTYLNAGKKVLITAPTNNAVEETLYGVINVLETAGVKCEGKLLRLGIASREFAERFPKLCEDRVLIKEVNKIKEQLIELGQIQESLEKLLDLICEHEEYERQFAVFREEKPLIRNRIEEIERERRIAEEAQVNVRLLNGRITVCDVKTEGIGKQIDDSALEVAVLEGKVRRYSTGLLSRLRPKRKAEYAAELNTALEKAEKLRVQKADLEKARNDDAQKLEHEEMRYKYAFENGEKLKKELTVLPEELIDLEKSLENILKEAWNREDALSVLIAYERKLDADADKFNKIKGATAENIQTQIEENSERQEILKKRMQRIENKAEVNIGDCKIIAATADTCLARLLPDDGKIKFDHVFLDEAGYCPLVKGAALTAYHCPLTFLGDHMQLPPVCEMNGKEIENNPSVSVWAQSALYTEDALAGKDIFDMFKHGDKASFGRMKKFELRHSFRFGEKLARVLDDMVYGNGFRGSSEYDTKICCIHAKKSGKENEKRMSDGEAEAIKKYLLRHSDEKIGVITPYKNQRKLLKSKLKEANLPEEIVMTIHGAQGREWDTVMLSIVDSSDKEKWFTTVKKQGSNGKMVINTAVSRARKKLVIVCDEDYWRKEANKEEIIYGILQCAERTQRVSGHIKY